MISVIILTKNEELDLPMCLESVAWSDDVHVLDSGSTDRTVELAYEYGTKVWHNAFESFGKQRNFALDHINTKYDWILFLDADEVVTDEFRTAILKATNEAKNDVAGFYCCWKMMLEGRWLKHCDNFPKWQFRLMRKGMARFTDFGHGQKEGEVNGQIEYIKEPYLHFGFSKGWFYWIERHNKYSSLEAQSRLASRPPLRNIFARHASHRNPALKSWLSRVPGWPLLRFIQAYFFNLGFLEGAPGFIYCTNMSYYEFLIQLKIREIKKAKKHTQILEAV
ncbi:glycosyltransferase family 2 protein [Spirosoma sp. KNUC1025]|uniref:glycosyltransferase family 2 protein n=1 Tax=Spirosoma sp. KNUC1025 TaxID=2894082 RepID=UPI00386CB89A|nr:glycosyltransferase family 2 protein [Spirosoma sp. KNUC1025]